MRKKVIKNNFLLNLISIFLFYHFKYLYLFYFFILFTSFWIINFFSWAHTHISSLLCHSPSNLLTLVTLLSRTAAPFFVPNHNPAVAGATNCHHTSRRWLPSIQRRFSEGFNNKSLFNVLLKIMPWCSIENHVWHKLFKLNRIVNIVLLNVFACSFSYPAFFL